MRAGGIGLGGCEKESRGEGESIIVVSGVGSVRGRARALAGSEVDKIMMTVGVLRIS